VAIVPSHDLSRLDNIKRLVGMDIPGIISMPSREPMEVSMVDNRFGRMKR